MSTTRFHSKEDADIAFCQLAIKRGYIEERVFKECLVAHAAIKKMGLSKPGIREIVMSKASIKPEHIVEIMAVLGARAGQKEIEGYSLIKKVASGAFGSIYKAKQDSMDRIVALKVLPRRLAVNKLYVKNFMRETKLALQETGRRLSVHLSRRRRAAEAQRKRVYIETYLPHLAVGLQQILGFSQREHDRVVRDLEKILERRSAAR